MKIKSIAIKTLPFLAALSMMIPAGCGGNFTKRVGQIPTMIGNTTSEIATTIIGERYKSPVYDKIFSAKGSSSTSEDGLEVFVAKYKDKDLYKKQKGFLSFLNAPVNKVSYGWELMLKDSKGLHRLTNNLFSEYHPKIDPKGAYVIFEREEGEPRRTTTDIYKIDLTTKKEIKLTNLTDCRNPMISPDGEAIAFNHNGSIWIMDKDGNKQKEIPNLNVEVNRLYQWTEEGLSFCCNGSFFPNGIVNFDNREIKDYKIK